MALHSFRSSRQERSQSFRQTRSSRSLGSSELRLKIASHCRAQLALHTLSVLLHALLQSPPRPPLASATGWSIEASTTTKTSPQVLRLVNISAFPLR